MGCCTLDREEKTVAGATASGLLRSICNFKFIFILNSLNRLFGQINKLNESLQNSKIDIIKARELALHIYRLMYVKLNKFYFLNFIQSANKYVKIRKVKV